MFLVVSLALTIVGILLMWRVSRKMRGRVTILVDILGIILIGFGLYLLWQKNPIYLLAPVALVGMLLLCDYYQNRPEVKSRNIRRIYEKLKEAHPNAENKEIYRKAAKQYYKIYTNWSDIKRTFTVKNLVGLEENDIDEPESIEEFVDRTMLFEKNSPPDITP